MANTTLNPLPSANDTVTDVMFGNLNAMTGGMYINVWLAGFAGILFIGSLLYGQGGKKSSLYASFGTFMMTFLFTLLGITGGNQLIPVTVIMLGSFVINYLDKGGGI